MNKNQIDLLKKNCEQDTFTKVDRNFIWKWARVLSLSEFRIYITLKSFVMDGKEKTELDFSQEEWASLCCVSMKTFVSGIETLEKKLKLIEVIHRKGRERNFGYTNQYRVKIFSKLLPEEVLDQIKKFPDKINDPLFPSDETDGQYCKNYSMGDDVKSTVYNNNNDNKNDLKMLSKDNTQGAKDALCSFGNLQRKSLPKSPELASKLKELIPQTNHKEKAKKENNPIEKDWCYKLIKHWNKKDFVPKIDLEHGETKTYLCIKEYFQLLKDGTFQKKCILDPKWISVTFKDNQYNIERYLQTPDWWDDNYLKEALDRIADMYIIGNQPEDKTWFKHFTLSKWIYNPKAENSWFIKQFLNGTKVISEQTEKRTVDRLDEDGKKMYYLLEKTIRQCKKVPLSTMELRQLLGVVDDFKVYHEKIPHKVSGILGADSFTKFLCDIMIDKYEGWEGIEPRLIKPDTTCFNTMIREMSQRLCVDIYTGRSLI
jgi:hypothetical protein